jgi:hypothetical protein
MKKKKFKIKIIKKMRMLKIRINIMIRNKKICNYNKKKIKMIKKNRKIK